MRPSLALGYALIALQATCLALIMGLARFFPAGFSGLTFFLVIVLSAAHIGLWLWMLMDLNEQGFRELPVMLSIMFVLMGGVGAILYFFIVRLSRRDDGSGPRIEF